MYRFCSRIKLTLLLFHERGGIITMLCSFSSACWPGALSFYYQVLWVTVTSFCFLLPCPSATGVCMVISPCVLMALVSKTQLSYFHCAVVSWYYTINHFRFSHYLGIHQMSLKFALCCSVFFVLFFLWFFKDPYTNISRLLSRWAYALTKRNTNVFFSLVGQLKMFFYQVKCSRCCAVLMQLGCSDRHFL